MEAAATAAAITAAWVWMDWSSPFVKEWLVAHNITVPNRELDGLSRFYYTFVTAVRDFPLMRSGILFAFGYMLVKPILRTVTSGIYNRSGMYAPERETPMGSSWISSAAGGLLGCVTGAGRALMLVAVLFICTALFPHTPFTEYVGKSQLYQKGATEVIQPFAGNLITERLPVFTRAVESEFQNVLQRKYEVLDANVPNNIAAAAKEVTAKSDTEIGKAEALYQWVGTRVQYDWDKVNLYESKGIWREQTPEDTFKSRKGVCIDFARLYAVMAKSAGIEVKVVTGLGYDGQGGYGPHAWNEVFDRGHNRWVPLDPTWVASGGNWFDPPNFNQTHIRQA
jgi:transglutaminase-like putative cysteine protease